AAAWSAPPRSRCPRRFPACEPFADTFVGVLPTYFGGGPSLESCQEPGTLSRLGIGRRRTTREAGVAEHTIVVKFALCAGLVLALASTAGAAVFIDVPSPAVGALHATPRTGNPRRPGQPPVGSDGVAALRCTHPR